MSLKQKISITRGLIATALVVAPVASAAAIASPQVPTTTSVASPRASTVRARCAGCSDSARANHEMLLSKLDSLRWQFTNRRLTEAEQEVFAREMSATLKALQQFMESTGARLRLAPTPRSEATAGAVVSGDAYTFTVQVSRRGYLGVTFDGPSIGYPAERPDVIRFIHYPKIASVDPASPAERAGLIMGDTLLAMNGTDVVENSITLSKVLVPDEKVTLRVRRNGDAKEFRVVVGEAPAYVARRVAPSPAAEIVSVMPYMPNAAPPGRAEVGARAARSPEPSLALPPPRSWEEPVQPRAFFYSTAIGGARVETLTEGLGKAFGVKEGVLVMQVPPGSPAFVSGLREGDVITAAAGTPVASARQLSSVVSSADRENGVKLIILREKKLQDLTLRWK